MAQQAGAGRRCLRAFVSGFFVAVPVTVTVLDRVACVARVEGASMQVSVSIVQRSRKRGANLLEMHEGIAPRLIFYFIMTSNYKI